MPVEPLHLSLAPAEIELAQLFVDPNNPRFVGHDWQTVPDNEIDQERHQEEARSKLLREFGADKLRANLELNGYLPIDRIIVRKFKPDKYVVLEGNRRIAAAKTIGNMGAGGEEIHVQVLESLKKIPVLVYTGSDLKPPGYFKGCDTLQESMTGLLTLCEDGHAELQDSWGCRLFDIHDEGRMLFTNIQYDLLHNPKSARDWKLGFRWALFAFVDDLGWRQYEAAAYVAAELFGAEKIALTPSDSEGGVDLYAVIPNRGRTRIFDGPNASYKVVGQSKKYGAALEVGKAREFVHVLDAIRSRSAEIQSRVPTWFQESDGPVIGWLNAHSGFQAGSADIAKAHGIITSDTLKLCDSLLSVKRTPAFKEPEQLRDFFSAKILDALRAN